MFYSISSLLLCAAWWPWELSWWLSTRVLPGATAESGVWTGEPWRRAGSLLETAQEWRVSCGSTGMGVLFISGGNWGPGEPLLWPREDGSGGGSSPQGWLESFQPAPYCPP